MPDDELLALWLDDELAGSEQARVEQWTASRPDWAEWREETRAWKALVRRALPDELEPPAAEFFDARVQRLVAESRAGGVADPGIGRADGFGWRGRWWMPLAAAAGMAVCFWAGMRLGGPAGGEPASMATNVYTPEQGVEARTIETAGAVMILLEGVAAIPDSFEVPDRAADGRGPGPYLVRFGADAGDSID